MNPDLIFGFAYTLSFNYPLDACYMSRNAYMDLAVVSRTDIPSYGDISYPNPISLDI